MMNSQPTIWTSERDTRPSITEKYNQYHEIPVIRESSRMEPPTTGVSRLARRKGRSSGVTDGVAACSALQNQDWEGTAWVKAWMQFKWKAGERQDETDRNRTPTMGITRFSFFRAIRFCNSLSGRGGGTKASYAQNGAQPVFQGSCVASRLWQHRAWTELLRSFLFLPLHIFSWEHPRII